MCPDDKTKDVPTTEQVLSALEAFNVILSFADIWLIHNELRMSAHDIEERNEQPEHDIN
jgi:hypothetical protein